MVWFDERNGAFHRFETRDVEDGAGMFELVVFQPDGKECVERFDNSETLLQRQQELETSLGSHGWQGPFGRFF